MKRRITTVACIVSLCLLLGAVAWAGDGQIDIAEIPYTISSSGSYIVVDDLSTTATNTNGITIDADNVTLDLNGHAIIGPGKAAGTSGAGIDVAGTQYNIAIRNGTVRDWRWDGVDAGSANNSQFEALRCYDNGDDGLAGGPGSTVTGNTCYNNGDDGILGYYGSTVTGNSCKDNASEGIQTGNGVTVSGNTCYSNDGDGIQTAGACTVSGNTCQYNTGDGIQTSDGCTLSGNTCMQNTGDGIHGVYGGSVTGNTCYSNTGDGIEALRCIIAENCCYNNGTNYNLTSCTSVNNHP